MCVEGRGDNSNRLSSSSSEEETCMAKSWWKS
jgi:hypothetical protein